MNASATVCRKTPDLFRSFWIAGYESSTHINPQGRRLDMLASIEHDIRAAEDYRLLADFNIKTARDAVRWHLIDRGAGCYDFSSFAPMLEAALASGVQVIWDLFHYGWPDGLDLFSPAFVDRFAKFSSAVARFVREHSDEVPFYSPINEINFLAWGLGVGLLYSHPIRRDWEIKQQLVRAAIAACEAVWSVDPRARFTYPEPAIHVIPDRARPDLAIAAERYRRSQFEAWDMIAGFAMPELGGHPKYLDILGANFYYSNEWEVEGGARLNWSEEPRDCRWRPLHKLLTEIWARYERPLYVAETSHFGSGRGRWIREIGQEVCHALRNETPISGVCLYPILDRADWGDPNYWHHSGLWDLVDDPQGRLRRVADPDYAAALLETENLVESYR